MEISDKDIEIVEKDTRPQAKCSGFFRHRAGRIGASVSGTAFHTNLAQPSQSLIKTICYPHLYKAQSSKAIRHGRRYEDYAIKAYETQMKATHVNFQLQRCGLFINKEHPFLHATPDFLMSCDCCGLGCGEVKCPLSLKNSNFEHYVSEKSSFLEKVNGQFHLKRSHNYYFQVQQQLFTLPERKHCDFVVCTTSQDGNIEIVSDRIKPDLQFSLTVVKKIEMFWKICILPEVLGRWYTRRCDVPIKVASETGICFCRGQKSDPVVSCANTECPYGFFHTACLVLDEASLLKTWYCPHCCRLPQFKRGRSTKRKQQLSEVNQAAMLLDTICICNGKADLTAKLLECHGGNCDNGRYFHLNCLGLKRMPNNAKTTWKCLLCRKDVTSVKPTTCTSSSSNESTASEVSNDSSDSDTDIEITGTSTGTVDKYSALAKLTSTDFDIISDPAGWLTCDIIQEAQVLLQAANPALQGLQRPTLGCVKNFDVVTSEFIQILHTGNDHWVCISSIGCVPGTVGLFDSLFSDTISQEVEEQTNDLLGGNLVSLEFVPIQQQTNGSNCGIFAIAFATCLALGTNPIHVTFDIPRMRPHLLDCFKEGKITMFPIF